MESGHKKTIIGSTELISIGRRVVDIPAKIDTGADGSAIWASNVRVGRDGILRFSLFGEGSPYYNGKIFKRTDFSVAKIRSSNGQSEIRYLTHFTVYLGGRRIKVLMSLADRRKNEFAALIGRRTIAGKFLVDVKKMAVDVPTSKEGSAAVSDGLRNELRRNPYAFYKKYAKNKETVS